MLNLNNLKSIDSYPLINNLTENLFLWLSCFCCDGIILSLDLCLDWEEMSGWKLIWGSCDQVVIVLCRRTAHASTYDKNLDDQVRPTVVPDEVIQPESEKYWAPHPQTGVFGPATEQNTCVGVERGFHFSPAKGEDSVLEEKAWFRPTSLEDLEKPHHPWRLLMSCHM